ncbi:hypothetical protein T11_10811 [Trichinella zimbabwensis]|uniref:Uncharacterized protein n=1 Tax=Trichinella zimbabwensis TaxID=268475 RepID=A0A0V1DPF2_9BILA|nr:hypothetical protein T11_10811 [Trichinella zimbabwensis]
MPCLAMLLRCVAVGVGLDMTLHLSARSLYQHGEHRPG